MGKKILFVDDEVKIRKLVEITLKQAGFDIITASNVKEALKLVFAEFPDLIISDVMMPGESGFSLCEKIKTDPVTSDIPIIFLTSLEAEQTAEKLGAVGVIYKPFEPKELLALVNKIFLPQLVKDHYKQAVRLCRSKKFEEAKKLLDKAIEIDPSHVPSLYYLGMLAHRDGNMEKATDYYRDVIKNNNEHWQAYANLGRIFETKEDFEQSVRYYKRSLSLNPEQPVVKKRMGILQSKL